MVATIPNIPNTTKRVKKAYEMLEFIRKAEHPVTINEMVQDLGGRGITFENRNVIDVSLTNLKKRGLVKQDESKRYFAVEHAPAPQGDPAVLADVKAALAELWRLFNVVVEEPSKLDSEISFLKTDIIDKGVKWL